MSVKRRRSFNPQSLLAKVGAGGSVGRYGKEQVVFSQGDPADAVFYLRSGKVKVSVASEEGKTVSAAIHGANAFFGEGCLAGQTRRMWTVTTVTDAVIVRVEKAAILRTIHDDPAFSEMFIAHLVGLIIRLKADLLDQLLNSSENRLARLLLQMTNFGKNGKAGPTITNVSQETLADMIGTTRSRVSFFMNKFRKLGLIDYKGGINSHIEVHRSLLKAALQ
jgi:CRP/FNR family transcriptional regulator, cyclic AMP receptor protein